MTRENEIKSNAEMAIDQRNEYENVEDALDAYYENISRPSSVRESAIDFDAFRDIARKNAAKLGISLIGTKYE